MGYSTLEQVKQILQITETTWDQEIVDCIVDADQWVDSSLKLFTAVPLTGTIPGAVVVASKNKAAAFYRERRDPVGAKAYLETAVATLKDYIQNTYYRGIMR